MQVKLEFLRMLVRMELDPTRMTLLTGFFETYLRLNEEEEKQVEAEIGKIDAKEVEVIMEITTSWEQKGRVRGRAEGKVEGQADLLIRSTTPISPGPVPGPIKKGIARSLSGRARYQTKRDYN